MKRRVARAAKKTALIVSVFAAALTAGATFLAMTNRMHMDKYFVIQMAMFILSVEYIFIFMYANDAFREDAERDIE